MFITWIAKTFVALNTNTKPLHIALAMALAFLAGMIPPSLLFFAILIIGLLVKLNQSIFLVFTAIFSLISGIFLPITSKIGVLLLEQQALFGFFTWLKNAPILAFSDFDFSAVSGGLVFGILMYLPVTLLALVLVKGYRKYIRDKIAESKIAKSFKKIPLVGKLSKAAKKFYTLYQAVR